MTDHRHDHHDHGHGHDHLDEDGHFHGDFDEMAKTWDDDPAKVEAGDLPATAAIVDLDLGAEPRPTDRWDLALAVQVLHHVDDLEPVLAGFAEVLAPGGTLCVVDLELEDGSFHGEGFGGHHGFDRDELAAQLRAAGFADVAFEHAYDLVRDDHAYPLFLATATR